MSIAARLNDQITRLAVGRHLPHRTVRLRLTLLYGGLFLLSGAALMAIAYALLVWAGFVFTLQSNNQPVTPRPPVTATLKGPPPGLPTPGSTTHPSAQTMAHWRDVALCMRQHGIEEFPDPTTSVPRNPGSIDGVLSDHDGAVFVIPVTINMQTSAFADVAATCGFVDAYQAGVDAQDKDRRTQTRQELLIQSGIALAGVSLLSLGLGWLMAGRVLQPLEDAYHAQRQFVANAAHELRAPLTRLRTLSEVALASPDTSSASLRHAHERVLASEQHLEKIIDGLLALARGQAGVERRECVDLAAVASQTMLVYGPEIAERDLDVQAALDPAPTDGDSRLLERLVANLVDNAVHHNTSAGRLQITTGSRDRHAFLTVANTGPVVPPEEIGRLFEPFQRLGAARTGHNDGQGLGLSIVEAIADAHRAEITARVRPEGGLAIELCFRSRPGGALGQHSPLGLSTRGHEPASRRDDA